ncbi:MAG: ImmA/IrrE family metallo-endopeptidase, partial [Anaerolineaceae bacterium]|nr:ImmA/IrrE family metallo-endopeptidase [Anaerolineaceae bacterium]
MKIKIIKTEAEYQEALEYIESLMDSTPGSPEEEILDVLSLLIEKYEQEHYPIDLPDPIEAIRFRMEQQGLTQKDMRRYIGSQSKVSEVLNYKRQLCLSMIRSLYEGLGIPAEVLLQEPGKEFGERHFDYKKYPFTEMFNRGYFRSFNGTLNEAKEYAEELLEELFSVFQAHIPQPVYCRNTDRQVNEFSLTAWQSRVLGLALDQDLPPYTRDSINEKFIRETVRLSYYSKGPQLAQELLNKKGIHLIILPHLPKTYLDGACFLSPSGRPVIGMTLRYDRLDNYWFTLIHELAHVHLHFDNKNIAFFDDTEYVMNSIDPKEIEANIFANNMLIPAEIWEQEAPKLLRTKRNEKIILFADQVRISPAIVAG